MINGKIDKAYKFTNRELFRSNYAKDAKIKRPKFK